MARLNMLHISKFDYLTGENIMEKYLYIKARKYWHYIHPINRFITRIDYLIENLARRFKKTIFTRLLKY